MVIDSVINRLWGLS